VSPEQKLEKQAHLSTLQYQAKSGTLLAESDWQELIQCPDGYNNRSQEWLFNLIGRPDESISAGGYNGTYVIYKNKCLDAFTGKPGDLCFNLNFGMVDTKLFDAQRVRNLR